jgi:uncharacterized membrane-anchored protein YhcB (DUF1043 family)
MIMLLVGIVVGVVVTFFVMKNNAKTINADLASAQAELASLKAATAAVTKAV